MALLDIARIRTDGGTQIRVKTHEDAIEEYANAYLDDKKLPPVQVVFDGENYWAWDGMHRIAGAKQAGKKSINVDVTRGTLREAIEKALGANTEHGIRRSNDDKVNAVMTMLRDPEWSQLSNREIARKCHVSPQMVDSRRHEVVEVVKVGEQAENGADGVPIIGGGKPSKRAERAAAKAAAKEAAEKSGDVKITRPKPAQLGAVEDIARERDEYKAKLIEMGDVLEDTHARLELYQSAEKLGSLDAALLAENEQLKKEVAALQSRLDGIIEEKNAAITAANRWKKKAKAA